MEGLIKLANTSSVSLCLVALLATGAGTAQARDSNENQSKEKRFSAEASAGLEYSSNISIDEIDVVSGSEDFAALLGFGLGYEFDITSKTSLDIDYSYSQSIHDELEEFDLTSHFGVADLSQDFGKIDVGLSYRYLDTSLDGDDFMDYRQAAPYITALLGTKVFVRAEYAQADKTFDTETDRDADIESIGTDWFFFLGSPRTYFLLGFRADEHDAVSTEYVYDQDNFKLHFVKRFKMFGNSGKFNVGLRYELRDYQFVTQSIGVPREDDRRKFRLSLELPITSRFGTEIKYEVRDFDSNLPEADRSEQVGSIEFVAEF